MKRWLHFANRYLDIRYCCYSTSTAFIKSQSKYRNIPIPNIEIHLRIARQHIWIYCFEIKSQSFWREQITLTKNGRKTPTITTQNSHHHWEITFDLRSWEIHYHFRLDLLMVFFFSLCWIFMCCFSNKCAMNMKLQRWTKVKTPKEKKTTQTKWKPTENSYLFKNMRVCRTNW